MLATDVQHQPVTTPVTASNMARLPGHKRISLRLMERVEALLRAIAVSEDQYGLVTIRIQRGKWTIEGGPSNTGDLVEPHRDGL